jgi:hypothetical protein
MHDIMAGHVERGDVPGIVTLVSRRGDVHVDRSMGRSTTPCPRTGRSPCATS